MGSQLVCSTLERIDCLGKKEHRSGDLVGAIQDTEPEAMRAAVSFVSQQQGMTLTRMRNVKQEEARKL